MPVIIKITKFNDSLSQVLKRTQNTKPLMQQIAGIMMNAVEENFASEGSRLPSGSWPQLAKSTLRQLAKKGKTGKMLQRSSGGLASSISAKSTKTTAEVGTNKVYASIHQFGGVVNRKTRSETFKRIRYKKGTKKGKFKKGTIKGQGFSFKAYTVTIPARPYLGLNQQDDNKILNAIDNFHKI